MAPLGRTVKFLLADGPSLSATREAAQISFGSTWSGTRRTRYGIIGCACIVRSTSTYVHRAQGSGS